VFAKSLSCKSNKVSARHFTAQIASVNDELVKRVRAKSHVHALGGCL
jgi:hypothetical protein